MKLLDAEMQLLALKLPVIQTSDASACLKVSRQHASQILVRLAHAGVVVQVARGLWAFANTVDPLILPEYLTAPFPAYVSLQTALYYHGMIDQIPAVTYAVSIARTRKITTPLGSVSIHHIDPNFFLGFEMVAGSTIKMACREKALLDIFYLRPSRSLLFRALPELDFPTNFKYKKAWAMIEQIPNQRLRSIVAKNLELVSSLRCRH